MDHHQRQIATRQPRFAARDITCFDYGPTNVINTGSAISIASVDLYWSEETGHRRQRLAFQSLPES